MAKQNPYAKKMSDIFPQKEVDQNASSCAELAASTGVSYSHTQKLIRDKLGNNEIEQVWKRNGTRLVAAYRPKRTK